MKNKTLTSVEWLISKLTEKPIEDINDEYWFGIIGQAKELEKQQIIKAHLHGVIHQFDNPNTASDDYFNQTYGEQA